MMHWRFVASPGGILGAWLALGQIALDGTRITVDVSEPEALSWTDADKMRREARHLASAPPVQARRSRTPDVDVSTLYTTRRRTGQRQAR